MARRGRLFHVVITHYPENRNCMYVGNCNGTLVTNESVINQIKKHLEPFLQNTAQELPNITNYIQTSSNESIKTEPQRISQIIIPPEFSPLCDQIDLFDNDISLDLLDGDFT